MKTWCEADERDLVNDARTACRTKRKLAAVAAGAAVVGLVGCGGSSGSQAAQAKDAASPSPAQDVAADKAAAQAAVLKIADLPTGWTAKTDDSSDDSDAADKQIAKCLGITVDELNAENPTEAESPDFEDADNHTISSSVEYQATSAELNDDFTKASDPKVPGCLQKALGTYFDEMIKNPKNDTDKLPDGVKIGKPQVGQMSFPQIGDKSLAYRITVPIQAQGLSVTAYVDLVIAVKGRASTEMTFESVFQPVEPATEQKYTELVVGRLTRTTDAEAA